MPPRQRDEHALGVRMRVHLRAGFVLIEHDHGVAAVGHGGDVSMLNAIMHVIRAEKGLEAGAFPSGPALADLRSET